MIRSFLVMSVLVLVGCTTVKLNDDNTNTITYNGSPEAGVDLATRACRKAGERRAIIISTINKGSVASGGDWPASDDI